MLAFSFFSEAHRDSVVSAWGFEIQMFLLPVEKQTRDLADYINRFNDGGGGNNEACLHDDVNLNRHFQLFLVMSDDVGERRAASWLNHLSIYRSRSIPNGDC